MPARAPGEAGGGPAPPPAPGPGVLLGRLRARLLVRRLRWDCPAWRGRGRYLDVGCGSGGALGVAAALGWQVAGVEVDAAAAAKARRFTPRVHTGDLQAAPFAAGEFDLITALHVLEHVPHPGGAVRRVLRLAAAGGPPVSQGPKPGGRRA